MLWLQITATANVRRDGQSKSGGVDQFWSLNPYLLMSPNSPGFTKSALSGPRSPASPEFVSGCAPEEMSAMPGRFSRTLDHPHDRLWPLSPNECLYACMYACMYVCTYVCMHVCICRCMCLCLCICTCLCTCTCTCTCICMCMYMYMCMYMHMYMCMCMCMYIDMCVCMNWFTHSLYN